MLKTRARDGLCSTYQVVADGIMDCERISLRTTRQVFGPVGRRTCPRSELRADLKPLMDPILCPSLDRDPFIGKPDRDETRERGAATADRSLTILCGLFPGCLGDSHAQISRHINTEHYSLFIHDNIFSYHLRHLWCKSRLSSSSSTPVHHGLQCRRQQCHGL